MASSSSLSTYFIRPKLGRIPDLKHSLAISHHFANLKADPESRSPKSNSSHDSKSSISSSSLLSRTAAPLSKDGSKGTSIGLSYLHFAREPEQQRHLGYGSATFPISSSSNPTLSNSKTSFKQFLEETDHQVPFPSSKVSDLPDNDSWNTLNSKFTSQKMIQGKGKSKAKSKSKAEGEEVEGDEIKVNDKNRIIKSKRIGPSRNKLGLRDIENFTGIQLPDWWDGDRSRDFSSGRKREEKVSINSNDETDCFLVKATRRISPTKSRTSSSISNFQQQRIESLIGSHFPGFYNGLKDSLNVPNQSRPKNNFDSLKHGNRTGRNEESEDFNCW